MNDKQKPKIILLAEDDPDDIYLISEAIVECGLETKLFVVENGEELLDYCYQRKKYQDPALAPHPDLILLDLNMPLKDGREALEEIKRDAKLRMIPIVILTTSKADEDLQSTYELGASGFITKPTSFSGLREIMCRIGSYWFSTVTLPEDQS